jgi:hypothetical protein
MEVTMKHYLTIDPGLKHLAFCLVRVWTQGPDKELKVRLVWEHVYDVSGQVNPDKDIARRVFIEVGQILGKRITEGLVIDQVLVEFQPPLATRANPALVRWNTWVEAYAVSFFHHTTVLPEIPVSYIHSAAMKRRFDISTGQYHLNKQMSCQKARSFVDDPGVIKNDHQADCVLMAVFEFLKKI